MQVGMCLDGISVLFIWLFRTPCFFRVLTGLYCPGCGGTRAVKYLFCGRPGMSFVYHPLILYVAVAAAVEMTGWLAVRRKCGPRQYPAHGKEFLYGALVLILGNWMVKNIALIFFGIDLLEAPLF